MRTVSSLTAAIVLAALGAHGSAQQRQQAFSTGYRTGSVESCTANGGLR